MMMQTDVTPNLIPIANCKAELIVLGISAAIPTTHPKLRAIPAVVTFG